MKTAQVLLLAMPLLLTGCTPVDSTRSQLDTGSTSYTPETTTTEPTPYVVPDPILFERTDDPTTTRDANTGDLDCTDFSDQADAQQNFEDAGGPDEDPYNLDRDGDGIACESL